jgi:DUF971 family protein
MTQPPPVPLEIDRSSETEVRIVWADGHRSEFSARSLRLLCPCAECVEETTGRRILDPRTVPADVRALSASLVGRYAVEFDWSDGHATGIYSYVLLRWACPCEECRAAAEAAAETGPGAREGAR